MTEHTHGPVTLSRPEPSRSLADQPKRLLQHRAWLVEAGLRARWGDRYASEHAMHVSLYGYDPVTLQAVRRIIDDDGSSRFEPDPNGAAFLLKLADDDVRAAHITADLMLQFAGEIAAQQVELAADQFERRTPTPMARRADMVKWFRDRANSIRYDVHRATPNGDR